jgi:hypothetical protein
LREIAPGKNRFDDDDRRDGAVPPNRKSAADAAGMSERQRKTPENRRIFDLWMACHAQEEIAEEVGICQGEAAKVLPTATLPIRIKQTTPPPTTPPTSTRPSTTSRSSRGRRRERPL